MNRGLTGPCWHRPHIKLAHYLLLVWATFWPTDHSFALIHFQRPICQRWQLLSDWIGSFVCDILLSYSGACPKAIDQPRPAIWTEWSRTHVMRIGNYIFVQDWTLHGMSLFLKHTPAGWNIYEVPWRTWLKLNWTSTRLTQGSNIPPDKRFKL